MSCSLLVTASVKFSFNSGRKDFFPRMKKFKIFTPTSLSAAEYCARWFLRNFVHSVRTDVGGNNGLQINLSQELNFSLVN